MKPPAPTTDFIKWICPECEEAFLYASNDNLIHLCTSVEHNNDSTIRKVHFVTKRHGRNCKEATT